MLSTHSFRSLLLAFALLIGAHGIAQNFSGFSYQAVVRDNVGDPVPSQTVGVQVTIQVGPTDTYVETHSATTDAYGLIALTIGQGTPVGGSAIPTFADVQWASGLPITYSVAVDVTGGTNYTFLSGGPFKAVPFAMHALTSDSSTTSVPQTLTLSNDTLYITGGNGVDLSSLAGTPGWVLSGDTLHNNGRRVGIGTSAPDTTLHVVGGIKYQDGSQGAAKVLTSDDSGNASWQNLSAESIFGSGNVSSGDLSCLSNLGTVAAGTSPRSVAVLGNYAYVANFNSNNMMVFNISNPAAPTLSATIATGNHALSVAVAGNYAYVSCSIVDNMMVFNISNPAAPTLSATIATGVNPVSMAVAGNYAYVVNNGSSTMMVFNISNPAAPSLSATIATGTNPTSVAVLGNYAYVANSNSNNMMVFNISNPAAPSLSATIATGVRPFAVAVSGNNAYVVNNTSNNMMVFDISSPAAPSLIATIATGTGPNSVAVAGNNAYVLNGTSNTMTVFDISNPAAPSLSAIIATGNSPRAVAVSGNHAYVANFTSNNMMVFNLFCANSIGLDPVTGELTSQPTAWSSYGNHIANTNTGNVGVGTPTPAAKLHVAGNVRIADGSQGTAKILTSDANGTASWQNLSAESIFGNGNVPSADVSCIGNIATIATGSGPISVAVAGSYAYVASQFSNNLMVFNISNPAAPSLSATIATGNNPHSVAVAGNYAYVVNYNSNNLMVFNISNPAAPSLSATIATGTNPASVAVAGNYAYVVNANSNNLTVFNISNPATPSFSATIATGSYPFSVAVSGSYAYVVNAASNNLQVFNISNPAAPSLSATIATGTTPNSVAVAGNYAYVVNNSSNTMMVFNISNPVAPSLSATIATGAIPESVAVAGNYAYVVNAVSNTMMVFNISNPAAPSLSATIATGPSPKSVAVSGNYAHVMNWSDDTMLVYNLFCPHSVAVDPATGGLTSQTAAWTTYDDIITNTNTGNVGIGTTTATDKLTVRTASSNYGFTHTDGAITVGSYVGGSTGGGWFGTKSNHNLHFFTNNSSPQVTLLTSGNLGIGTTTPGKKLTVLTSGNGYGIEHTNGTVSIGTYVSTNGGYLGTNSNNNLHFYTNGSQPQVTLTTSGDVGIGTQAPTALLSVNGSANKTGGGSWAVFSDQRLKRNVRPYGDGLGAVLAIEPVHFRYNSLAKTDTTVEYVGVIAQQLREVAPYMIDTLVIDGTEYLEVDNSAMTYMLVNAVKELNAMIGAQQAEIVGLRAGNAAKDEALNAIRAQLDANTALMQQLRSVLEAQSHK